MEELFDKDVKIEVYFGDQKVYGRYFSKKHKERFSPEGTEFTSPSQNAHFRKKLFEFLYKESLNEN